MNRFRKGDTVYYRAWGEALRPVVAMVKTAHRDNTYTVVALFRVDAETGEESHYGYLGYSYRMSANSLVSQLGDFT